MQRVHIKDKLTSMGIAIGDIALGDFDRIGHYTALRERQPGTDGYNRFGAFYRANYERGILIYNLIRANGLTSMLEIGFGRGYATFCAAKAFTDAGVDGRIVTIDPNMDENFLNALQRIFPSAWFACIEFIKSMSAPALEVIEGSFDLVYIDGDHSYAGTLADWMGTRKRFNRFMLFDDYHLPTKQDPGIQCARVIDGIDWTTENCLEPELLVADRRLFVDDRGIADDEIDAGQVLFSKILPSTDDGW